MIQAGDTTDALRFGVHLPFLRESWMYVQMNMHDITFLHYLCVANKVHADYSRQGGHAGSGEV